jgi:multidrug efflux pump subunit AcrB
MTLGGLALAVGILVDDATVTIENINWHLEQGKDVETAIMDGARQIVTPAFVSLLCICIVFVPMFFLEGVARFLFVPMALAVMFAMVCSFILSRTLVPTMANYLLKPHDAHGHEKPPTRNPLVLFQRGFEVRFERFRAAYHDLLGMALRHRTVFICAFMAFVMASFLLAPFLGRNFFPTVDSGQILMHARGPVGTRVEESANDFVDDPEGHPSDHPAAGDPDDGRQYRHAGQRHQHDLQQYRHDRPAGRRYPDQAELRITDRRRLRARVAAPTSRDVPGLHLLVPAGRYHQPDPELRRPVADRRTGPHIRSERRLRLCQQAAGAHPQGPGVVDARIQQSRASPVFAVDIDRTRAQYVGLTTRDVTNSLVVNLAGSSQVAPTYWLNPANGVTYSIVMQTPQYRLDSLSALVSNLPIAAPAASSLQVLGGIADVQPRHAANAVVSQYDLQSMVQIYAGVQGRDLGSVASDIRVIVSELAQGRAAAHPLGQAAGAGQDDGVVPSPACSSAFSARSC